MQLMLALLGNLSGGGLNRIVIIHIHTEGSIYYFLYLTVSFIITIEIKKKNSPGESLKSTPCHERLRQSSDMFGLCDGKYYVMWLPFRTCI